MAHDLLFKDATLVDGTGAAPRRASVAVKDGRISGIDDGGGAARTVDAEGLLLTPGFVDIHTHYDGQVSWDETLSPSSLHGVTTVIMGNCGVGFAPARAGDRQRLIDLMEGVEDIPGAALAEGIRWGWETFEEYMDALDRMPHAIDYAAQVPHDCVRVFVMGERAVANQAATDDDVAAMRAVVRRALEAGAVGFTTGRTDNHRSVDGSWTPGADASARELGGIAQALNGLSHGVLQAVSDFDMDHGPERFDAEFDVLEAMAAAAPGHPLSTTWLQRDLANQQWRQIARRAEQATARGVPIRLQTAARGIGVLLGLQATFHPFLGFPTYKKVSALPLAERVRFLKDPATRAQLLSETPDRIAGDGTNVPPMADRLIDLIDFASMKMFRLGASPHYEQPREQSLYAEAMALGKRPIEHLYDVMLESDGEELVYFPIFNYSDGNLDTVGEMLRHPLSLAALSDGGAHVGTVCDASFPTFMLTWWTRDRERERFPLEAVVQKLTRDNARFLGFGDRGTVEVGMRADLNLIDYQRLSLPRPRLVHDLPAGGRRLMQEAEGYVMTLVNGVVVRERGAFTGARPGRLARLGRG